MTNKNERNGWFYLAVNDEVKIYKGHVEPKRSNFKMSYTQYFYVDGYEDERFTCDLFEGRVWHGTVWLTERDDNLACELLVQQERERIEKCEKQIHKCKLNIERIRKGFSL